MSRTAVVSPPIEAYADDHTTPDPPYLAEVARRTLELTDRASMLTGHLEGKLLAFLVAVSGARRVLEIGTFTGYSALAMAEALPRDGRILTLEVSRRHAAISRANIAASPHAGKIEVRLGPALATMAELEPGSFDFVFIDADKEHYRAYYERALELTTARGLIAIDNTLWYGQVLDPATGDGDTSHIVALNEFLARDERVEAVMLTVRDGVTVVRKRGVVEAVGKVG